MNKIKVSFGDFSVIWIACYVYMLFWNILLSPMPRVTLIGTFGIPFLSSICFALVCWAVFTITIRLARSLRLFVFLTWAVFMLWGYYNITGAQEINLSLRRAGYDLYISGNITLWGCVKLLLEPLGIMAILSTTLYGRKKWQCLT